MTRQSDPDAIKNTQRRQWGRAAAAWRKHGDRLEELTEPVTQRLLELAGLAPGHRVLDIACGTGEPALPAARIVGPRGHVLATDMAPEMLDVARERAKADGLANIEFRLVDGEELRLEPESFDAATCRWGIMFMPEPERCFRDVFQALQPGARFAVSVWGPEERNPFSGIPLTVLRKYLETPPPDPTIPGGVRSFADPEKLSATFNAAGFRDVTIEGLELTMAEFDSGEEYWRYQREISAPTSTQLARLSPETQEKVGVEIAAAASAGHPEGKVSLTGYTFLGSGVK